MAKMTYEEWNEATNQHDMAVEMGYDCWEDVPPQKQLYITMRLAELWINYKADELITAE